MLNSKFTTVVGLGLGITYVLVSHWALIKNHSIFALLLAAVPILFSVLTWIYTKLTERLLSPWVKALLCLISFFSIALISSLLAAPEAYAKIIFLIQNAGVFFLLGTYFGWTLRTHGQELITSLAQAIHGQLAPDIKKYTRYATWAWTLFFLLMSITSVALYFFAPLQYWSLFINILSWPLVGLMFLVEYVVRRWKLPHAPKVNMKDSYQAFLRYQSK